MKKALIVASVASMIDQFNMENIRLLQRLGYEVHVACNFLEGSTFPSSRNVQLKKELEKINVISYQIDFSRKGIDFFKHQSAYKQLGNILEDNKYKLIHLHSPIGGAIGRLATRKLRKEDTKIIYTAHGFHFYKGAPKINWLFYYPIERMLSVFTDILITINQEDYRRAKKFKKTKVVYVPGIGVNTKKLKDIKVDKKQKRKELNIPLEAFLITSVGELSKRKNHRIVIEALGKIKNKNIHYVICGQGLLEEKLKKLSKKLKIENQIHFLGFRNDISEINLASDLFVFPSYQEGLPVALMESMAVGLPVVASDIRGNSDLLDKKGGELLPATNINAFAAAINTLHNESNVTLKEMGLYNQKKIKNYDVDNVINMMESIYII